VPDHDSAKVTARGTALEVAGKEGKHEARQVKQLASRLQAPIRTGRIRLGVLSKSRGAAQIEFSILVEQHKLVFNSLNKANAQSGSSNYDEVRFKSRDVFGNVNLQIYTRLI
jgi:hypothetical protein